MHIDVCVYIFRYTCRSEERYMKRNNKRFRMMDLSSLGRQNDGLEDGIAREKFVRDPPFRLFGRLMETLYIIK